MESLSLSSPQQQSPPPPVNPSPRRGPGRPPKPNNPSAQEGGPQQPARKRGRPPKQQQPPPAPAATSEKRRPGRPPKQQPAVVPFASDPERPDVVGPGRPRGRPRKSGLGPVSRPIGKRPRGRPRKAGGGGGGGVVVAGKRRGRPPKGMISPRKPRRISGKPLGRPRKVASAARNLTFQQGQGIPNEELTSKLELIQLKVREAIGLIRPYVANEYAAVMALQQLEELVTTNITGPPATSMDPPSPPPPVNSAGDASLTQPATVPEPGLGPAPGPGSGPFFGVPGPFSVNLPALNVTGPLHVPFGMESQQTMSWFPSSGTQS